MSLDPSSSHFVESHEQQPLEETKNDRPTGTTKDQCLVIKKYSNRRLYDTGASSYIRLEDLSIMVKNNIDFVVIDAKSEEDITQITLTQIVLEEENKGTRLLPIAFLKRMIAFYDQNVQAILPDYLNISIEAFFSEQQKMDSFIQRTVRNLEENTQSNVRLMQTYVDNNINLFKKMTSFFTSPIQQSLHITSSAIASSAQHSGATPKEKVLIERLASMEEKITFMEDQIQKLTMKLVHQKEKQGQK